MKIIITGQSFISYYIVMYSGSIHDGTLLHSKVNTLQLNTVGNSSNTRPTRMVLERSLL
jgi:hypothetical protein